MAEASWNMAKACQFFPQIAIAIGVLTSNRGEGDEPLWRIGRGTRVPLQGAVDVVPLLGAIVVCYGWGVTTNFGGVDVVPLLGAIAIVVCYGGGRRVTANFGGVDVVPLQGAIVVCYGGGESGCGAVARCHCHCSVLWWGEEGDSQLWGSGRGAIAGCHCRVPFQCAMVGGEGDDQLLGEWTWCHCCWVPLQGAIPVCYGGGGG